MPSVLKVLGQSAPAATTATTLYTVPAATSTVVSSIIVANRSATATAFRVSIRPAGAVQADQMYIYYDVPIGGNDTFIATCGISLSTTDVVTVYNTLATLSFNLYGQEQT
jgi:glucose-6-phosphate dehydrogenase assembly protein OpcA